MFDCHQNLLVNLEYELKESFNDKVREYESVCKKLEKEDQEVKEKTKFAYLKAILNPQSKTPDISFNAILSDIKNNSAKTKIVKALKKTPGSPLHQDHKKVAKKSLNKLLENTSDSGRPNSPIKDHEIEVLTSGAIAVNLQYALAQTEDLLQKCRKTLSETRKALKETEDKNKEANEKLILALNSTNENLTFDEIVGEYEESLKDKESQVEQNKTVIQNILQALNQTNTEINVDGIIGHIEQLKNSLKDKESQAEQNKTVIQNILQALNQTNTEINVDGIVGHIEQLKNSLKDKESQAGMNKKTIQNAVEALKKENSELERCYGYSALANYSIMLSIFSIASAFLYSYIMKFNIINSIKNFSFKNMACRIELGLLIGFLAFTTCFVIFKFKASSSTSHKKAINSELYKLENLDSSSNLNSSNAEPVY